MFTFTAAVRRRQFAYLGAALATLALLWSVAVGATRPGAGGLPGPAGPLTLERLGRLPLAFEPAGSPDGAAGFVAHAPGGTLAFAPAGVAMTLQGPRAANGAPPAVLRLAFVGANPAPAIGAGERLPGTVNYLTGSDPAGWRRNLPTYAGIVYAGLYPGVSLAYAGDGGHLKGTYTVAPGADPTLIRWAYQGAAGVTVDGAGALSVRVGAGAVSEDAPVAWQEIGGRRAPVAARYTLAADGTAGFALGAYDPAQPLIIDPAITFGTYLGGSLDDYGYGLGLDSAGNIYIDGSTSSTNFPAVSPLFPNGGGTNAFLTKINAAGTAVLFSTYLGGNGEDWAEDLAVDPAGNSYLVGRTSASNFPVTAGAYQGTIGGNSDMFLSKISPDGASLLYSTFLGGNGVELGRGVAVDAAGVAYVTGVTTSANFPVKNATQPALGGGEDFAIAKLDTTQSGAASCIYATYFGGSGTEYNRNFEVGLRVATDSSGAAYFTDDTTSTNYPTTAGVIQPALGSPGNLNAVVTKLDPAGALVWSTFLGGTSAAQARGIAVDGAGGVYVTGYGAGAGFPTTAGAYHACGGGIDLWVSKLNATATALDWSTCVGPGNAFRLALGEAGAVYVAGNTPSNLFPMVNPIQGTFVGGRDAILFKLNATGSSLLFSTYLGGATAVGGNGTQEAYGLALDGASPPNIVVGGWTNATDFPVANTLYPYAGLKDAFALVINQPVTAPTATPIPPTATPIPPTATRTATVTRTPIPGDRPPVVTVPLNQPYRVGVEVGNYLALRFDATDPDTGDVVTLSVSGLPAGAAFPIPAPGNPTHSTMTWRPTAPDIGTYYVTVTGTDQRGAQGSATVRIDVVAGCVPYFSDVYTAHYFYDAVHYLFCHLVVSGYIEPDQTFTFRPFNETTRGQFSKMIALAYHLPAYAPATPDFSDVPAANPFYTYVEAAYHAGIISGYADGTFHPYASITRGQLSKLIVGAAGWTIDTSGGPHFTDVPATSPFYGVIETAFNHSVVSGYACGGPGEPCDAARHAYFRAFNTATRGQIAKILWQALGSPPSQ